MSEKLIITETGKKFSDYCNRNHCNNKKLNQSFCCEGFHAGYAQALADERARIIKGLETELCEDAFQIAKEIVNGGNK